MTTEPSPLSTAMSNASAALEQAITGRPTAHPPASIYAPAKDRAEQAALASRADLERSESTRFLKEREAELRHLEASRDLQQQIISGLKDHLAHLEAKLEDTSAVIGTINALIEQLGQERADVIRRKAE